MPEVYRAKAELFRTLGHPARIRILEMLAERDRPVHELLATIDIEPFNLSQQLAVLRRAGLVDQRREGAEVVYSASLPAVAELLRVARGLLAADGTLARVAIVAPSFFLWPALPVALADTIVPDSPLANKSFNQSYAGNDL